MVQETRSTTATTPQRPDLPPRQWNHEGLIGAPTSWEEHEPSFRMNEGRSTTARPSPYGGPRQRRRGSLRDSTSGEAGRRQQDPWTMEPAWARELGEDELVGEPAPVAPLLPAQYPHPIQFAPAPAHYAPPVYYAAPPQYRAPPAQPVHWGGQQYERHVDPQVFLADVLTIVGHAFVYAVSIFWSAVRILRTPLPLITAVIFLSLTLTWIAETLAPVFSPICYIPFISSTSVCVWVRETASSDHTKPPKVQWADYPSLVDVQSKTFEQLVDDALLGSTTPSSLSLSLKKAEMATSDLIGLVRLSDIGSREQIAQALRELVQEERKVGLSLARLDARMNGAIDSVMAVNEYALHAIEGAAREKGAGNGLAGTLLPWRKRQEKAAEEVVKQTFLTAMNVLSDNFERILLEILVNTQNLGALEEKLRTVHTVVMAEDNTISEDRDELLANFWTRLGWNQKEIRNFERNLKLLKDLSAWKMVASARVLATQHLLSKASEEMGDMRERVALPNLAGAKIPPEVHMKIIRSGLERLAEGRARAKRLEEDAMREAMRV